VEIADNFSICSCSTGARIKKSTKGKDIKLKLRGKRFLYTLKLKDSDKADKIKQSLPPSKSPFTPCFRTVGEMFSLVANLQHGGSAEKKRRLRQELESVFSKIETAQVARWREGRRTETLSTVISQPQSQDMRTYQADHFTSQPCSTAVPRDQQEEQEGQEGVNALVPG